MDPFQQVTNITVLLYDLQPHGGKEAVEEERKREHCPAAVHRGLK